MKTQVVMKHNFFDFLDSLGLVWKYGINGLIGGLIWSLYKKSKFFDAVRQIVIGGVVSGYVTPVLVSKGGMSVESVGFTSFVVGMTGLVIVDSIYKYVVKLIKKWKEAIVIINNKN